MRAGIRKPLPFWKGLIDNDDRYLKSLYGGGRAAKDFTTETKGASLAEAVGGSHTAEAWKHNPLDIDPGRFSQKSAGAAGSSTSSGARAPFQMEKAKEFEQAEAQARSGAMALQEVKLEAEKTLRELKWKSAELATTAARAAAAAQEEAAKADRRPSTSKAGKRRKCGSMRKRKDASAKHSKSRLRPSSSSSSRSDTEKDRKSRGQKKRSKTQKERAKERSE